MKLSIVIPIYNSVNNLQRCLDSVMASPMMDMECVMVNDGSTDSSEVICKTYAEADRRFVYIRKDRGGSASAKNSGLGHSRGSYVMFLEPDDYFSGEAWDRINEQINQEMTDFTAFSYNIHGKDQDVELNRYPIKGENSKDYADVLRLAYTTEEFKDCLGILFDYDIIRKNKIKFQQDNPFFENLLFISEYLRYCKSGYVLNRPIIEHEKNEKKPSEYLINQRIGYIEHLYQYCSPIFEKEEMNGLKEEFGHFYFSLYRNLFLIYAGEYSGKELREIYSNALHHEFCSTLFQDITDKACFSWLEKLEAHMLARRRLSLLLWYFGARGKR